MVRFDLAATRRTPGYCRRPARPAASWTQGVGWREGRTASGRPSALSFQGSANQRWSVRRLSPTPRPQWMLAGASSQALRATMQRIAAALATRSIGLVDVAPVGIELLQYQQSCRPARALSLGRWLSCSSCRMPSGPPGLCSYSACW